MHLVKRLASFGPCNLDKYWFICNFHSIFPESATQNLHKIGANYTSVGLYSSYWNEIFYTLKGVVTGKSKIYPGDLSGDFPGDFPGDHILQDVLKNSK